MRHPRRSAELLAVGPAVLCASLMLGVLLAGCGSTSGPSEPTYDINGTWIVTTTGGGVVGVSTNVFSGSRTSGTVFRGQFVGTYSVTGTSVVWSVATQDLQGAFESSGSMSGSFTSSTRSGTWQGTRQ